MGGYLLRKDNKCDNVRASGVVFGDFLSIFARQRNDYGEIVFLVKDVTIADAHYLSQFSAGFASAFCHLRKRSFSNLSKQSGASPLFHFGQ